MLFYKINDLRYYYFEAEIKFNFCLYVIFLKVNIIFLTNSFWMMLNKILFQYERI